MLDQTWNDCFRTRQNCAQRVKSLASSWTDHSLGNCSISKLAEEPNLTKLRTDTVLAVWAALSTKTLLPTTVRSKTLRLDSSLPKLCTDVTESIRPAPTIEKAPVAALPKTKQALARRDIKLTEWQLRTGPHGLFVYQAPCLCQFDLSFLNTEVTSTIVRAKRVIHSPRHFFFYRSAWRPVIHWSRERPCSLRGDLEGLLQGTDYLETD